MVKKDRPTHSDMRVVEKKLDELSEEATKLQERSATERAEFAKDVDDMQSQISDLTMQLEAMRLGIGEFGVEEVDAFLNLEGIREEIKYRDRAYGSENAVAYAVAALTTILYADTLDDIENPVLANPSLAGIA